MKIREAITRADELCPNKFSDGQKLIWLAELDGKLALDVFLMDIAETQQFAYETKDMGDLLLVRFPHDEIYVTWLICKIELAQHEYARYVQDIKVFNAAYAEFVRWFARAYEPAQRRTYWDE